MQWRERRPDAVALAILVLLPTIFFADVLLGVANFCMRDLTRYYYPTKQIYREIVFNGELPLWNRYFGGGQPLAANPEHEIFYPPTWLTFLPSYDLGYRLHILLHIYIGLIAMYALLRSMRLRPAAAFLGALSWGMGGLYLSYINLLPILFCAAWLPLTCLYVRRFLIDRRLHDFALASLFLGLQFLVAEPTTIAQTGFIIGMYGLYRGWHGGVVTMARNTGWIALISLSGFAVGAVQMLAAIDLAGDSARARGFSFPAVSSWSMPWAKVVEFAYPNFLGHVAMEGEIRYWGWGLYDPMGAPFLFSIYPGLAVTAFAIAGLFCRIRGSALVAALSIVSIVLALGGHTPVLRYLYDAGIAASVRYPEKFILIAVFALTLFGAHAFDRILGGDERLRRTAAGFALATALIAGVVAILGFTPHSIEAWMAFFRLRPDVDTLAMAEIAWSDWSLAAARGFGLFLLLVSIALLRPRLWWPAAFLFVCVDLGPVVHELNPRVPARFFTTPPEIVRTLPPNRGDYRIFHAADWFASDRLGALYRDDVTARYWIARNGLFPAIPAAYGVRMALDRDYDATALLPTLDLVRSMWEVRRSGRADWLQPFLAMSNVWYVAAVEHEGQWLRQDVRQATPVRFVEASHHPRYYFADQIVEITGQEDFVRKLSEQQYSDRVAFVRGVSSQAAPGEVIGLAETANSAVIDVIATGRAFLVMSVTPHKYWRVSIDGAPVQPVVTNIGYQGVVVPEGRHRVVMTYRNPIITFGAIISVAAIMLLTIAAIFDRRGPLAVT